MTKGNQTDLAKLMGVSQPAVSQMVKKRIVRVEADGKILLEQAVEDWHTQVNVGQQRPFRRMGATTPSSREHMERYRIARTRREIAEAALAELKLQKALGQVLDADVVRKALADVALATRDRILSVPRRVAPELAGVQDEAEIADKINAEMENSLLALSENVL